MREIVSFTKEIDFKTMVHKITGISLEHTLKLTDSLTVEGEFLISGTYKMTGASQIEEDFNYRVPVDISIDEKYDTKNLEIDIYDFTYEVVNEETLKLSIELVLDNLELKEIETVEGNTNFQDFEDIKTDEQILKDLKEEIEIISFEQPRKEEPKKDLRYEEKDLFKEEETKIPLVIPANKEGEGKMPKSENNISVDSIFMAFQGTPETYSTYRVHIVRENDSVEEIMNKYNIPREVLEEYNNLNSIALGTKLIIPSTNG